MKKNIKDYLHYYLGAECMVHDLKGIITSKLLADEKVPQHLIKPILRPLSDMTEDELQEVGNMIYDFREEPELNVHEWEDFKAALFAEQFHYLLSKHFDLFGLIESGLAIDKTKVDTN